MKTKRAQAPGHGRLRPVKRSYFFFAAGRGLADPLLGHLARAEAAREFLHASGGIDELLLAGEKGMARRANAEAEILLGGAGVIDRAAGADDLAFHVFGVDIRFHGSWENYLKSGGGQAPSPAEGRICLEASATARGAVICDQM